MFEFGQGHHDNMTWPSAHHFLRSGRPSYAALASCSTAPAPSCWPVSALADGLRFTAARRPVAGHETITRIDYPADFTSLVDGACWARMTTGPSIRCGTIESGGTNTEAEGSLLRSGFSFHSLRFGTRSSAIG